MCDGQWQLPPRLIAGQCVTRAPLVADVAVFCFSTVRQVCEAEPGKTS